MNIESEHYIIGALLLNNDAIDRVGDLQTEHFWNGDHRAIYAEIVKQISAGKSADVITVFDALKDRINDLLPYLSKITANTASDRNIGRHSEILVGAGIKRKLAAIANDMHEATQSHADASVIADEYAAKIEQAVTRRTQGQPKALADSLGDYTETIQQRMDGKTNVIKTGFVDIDRKLYGGLERGTLTVVAGRPSMGKTAFGLALCHKVGAEGNALMFSMEMSEGQVVDRSVAALGRIPFAWLKRPDDSPSQWERMTQAFIKAKELGFTIDYQPGATILEMRSKARMVKRQQGLDLIVIDQLSFIGGSSNKDLWQAIGEYTRGLVALAKELNVAVVLLCQLNRELEKRANRRPIMSDLALSGSIEQDAALILFLYRDEVYNPDSADKGMCEVIFGKNRQGEIGTVGLAYIGEEMRFDNAQMGWKPAKQEVKQKRGFD